jgi:hypothetical protein
MSEAETPAPAPAPEPQPVVPEVAKVAPTPSVVPEQPTPTPVKPVEPPKTVIEVKLEQPKRSVVEFALVAIMALIGGVVLTALFVNFATSTIKLEKAKQANEQLNEEKQLEAAKAERAVREMEQFKEQGQKEFNQLEKELREEQERSIILANRVRESKDKILEFEEKYKNLEDILIRVKRGEVSVKVDKNYVPPGGEPADKTVLEKVEETLEEVEEADKKEEAEEKKQGKHLFKPWTWLRKSKK